MEEEKAEDMAYYTSILLIERNSGGHQRRAGVEKPTRIAGSSHPGR